MGGAGRGRVEGTPHRVHTYLFRRAFARDVRLLANRGLCWRRAIGVGGLAPCAWRAVGRVGGGALDWRGWLHVVDGRARWCVRRLLLGIVFVHGCRCCCCCRRRRYVLGSGHAVPAAAEVEECAAVGLGQEGVHLLPEDVVAPVEGVRGLHTRREERHEVVAIEHGPLAAERRVCVGREVGKYGSGFTQRCARDAKKGVRTMNVFEGGDVADFEAREVRGQSICETGPRARIGCREGVSVRIYNVFVVGGRPGRRRG